MRKLHRFRRDVARDAALQALFDELNDTRAALDDAYARFNVTVEPELVDACIFEINAIQARYDYLLRRVKESGGEAAFRAYSGAEATRWA